MTRQSLLFFNVVWLLDLCCSTELAEVEIISLIEEKLPLYNLRADAAAALTGN